VKFGQGTGLKKKRGGTWGCDASSIAKKFPEKGVMDGHRLVRRRGEEKEGKGGVASVYYSFLLREDGKGKNSEMKSREEKEEKGEKNL